MFMYALIRMPSVRLSLFRSSNLMGVNENNGQNVKGMHCESKTTTKGQRKPRPNVSTSLPFYFLLPKHKTTKKSGNGLWSKLSDSTNIAVITIPFNIKETPCETTIMMGIQVHMFFSLHVEISLFQRQTAKQEQRQQFCRSFLAVASLLLIPLHL